MEKKIRSLRKSIKKDISSLEKLISVFDEKQKQKILGSLNPLYLNIKKNLSDLAITKIINSANSRQLSRLSFGLHLERHQLDMLLGMVILNSTVSLDTFIHKKDYSNSSILLFRSFIKFLKEIENIHQKISLFHLISIQEDKGASELNSSVISLIDIIAEYSNLVIPKGISKEFSELVSVILHGESNASKIC